MKKIPLFPLLMWLMLLSVPFYLCAESISYTAIYNQVPQIGTDTLGGVTYSTVNYGNLFNNGAPGAPSLPVDYIKFSVPYNATNFSVNVSVGNSLFALYNLQFMLYPCQSPVCTNDTSNVVISLPDSAIYNSGNFYPTQKAWVVDEGFLAGENHVVTVAVMPFAYKHSSSNDKLKIYNQITVTLNYDLGNTPSISPIVSVNENARNDGFKLTESIVVNPNDVSSFAPNSSTVDTLFRPYHVPNINGPLTKYPYLIVTTSQLSHSLRRLVALKKQKGINVKLVTVDEIMSDPYAQYGDVVTVNGVPIVTYTDNPGIIRQYLKMAYWYNQSRYLLLAGTDVPYRKYPIFIGDVPTDMYYSDLTGNWMTGNMDKYPEYNVGRLLAKTKEQITNYTDKLFRYELNPGNGDYTYLRRALYTEAVNMIDDSRKVGKYMNSICPDSTIIQERPHQRYPKACDIIDSINTNKYGFLSTFNHGFPSCIVTYGVGNGGVAYSGHMYRLWAIDSYKTADSGYSDLETENGLNNINNKEYPCVLYSISCETMPYDLINPLYTDMPMNVGESFTTGKDYGGPAYIGNTRKGLNPCLRDMETFFAQRILRGYYKLGEAEALSKCDYSDAYDLYLAVVHNLLGDPTLEMWTDIPQQYTNIEIIRTDNSFTVSGLTQDSTIIAVYSNDNQIRTDTVSNSTVTINGISANSSIMLYKHNCIPYIIPLSLQNATLNHSQYVIASDVIAGNSIDSNRTSGDVIIPQGVEYEIEASGKVTIEDGFKVEKGATFAVYPACF